MNRLAGDFARFGDYQVRRPHQACKLTLQDPLLRPLALKRPQYAVYGTFFGFN